MQERRTQEGRTVWSIPGRAGAHSLLQLRRGLLHILVHLFGNLLGSLLGGSLELLGGGPHHKAGLQAQGSREGPLQRISCNIVTSQDYVYLRINLQAQI